MISSVRSSLPVWAVLLLTVSLLAGCSDNDKVMEPPDEGPYLQDNTDANVLTNLITAYRTKDIDNYTELFDVEQFTFVFDATDVENDPDLAPTWNWPEEFTSTRNMFESSFVLDVKLDYVRGTSRGAAESDGVPLEWTKVVVTNVQLSIDTIDPQGGENIIYKVAGDRGTFFFQSYPDEPISGQPRRRIVEWRDERVGLLLPVEETTWGAIKSIYN